MATPDGSYAPMAETCSECGSYVALEEHDAMCIRGWIADAFVADAEYTDDTTDMGWR